MPKINGISHEYQHALVDLMVDLIATPELDVEIQRRAQWLKWGLEGRDPVAEIRGLQLAA